MIYVSLSVVKKLTKEDCEYFADNFNQMDTPNYLTISWDTFNFKMEHQFKFNETCVHYGSVGEKCMKILKSGGGLEWGITISLFDNPRVCTYISTEPIIRFRLFPTCISINGEVIMIPEEDMDKYNQHWTKVLRKAVKAAIECNYEKYTKHIRL